MDYDKLSLAGIFSGMSPDDIRRTLESVPHRTRKFRSGSLIAQHGDPVNSVMIVVSGLVKGEMLDVSGRVIKIEDVPAPGMLAAAFLFGKQKRLPVNVIALSEGELLIIEKSEFLILLGKDVRILSNFLDNISDRAQFFSEKIKFLSFKTIRGKLAQYLIQLSEESASTVIFSMTRDELAGYFGVARPSLSRVLGEMEEEGIIEVHGKHVRITDRKRLVEMTCD